MAGELQPGDPRKVGPYWLLGRLGSGGMGRVFLARSPGGRQVAVKLVRAELAEQADFRARFGREVAAARMVSGLFTAPVVDADLDGPVPWLATAYVAGPSLADAVTRHGPLPVASVLALAAGLAEGLGAIHAAGVVHRDLKPSNVLLADDGPRIIDFGISRAAEASVLTSTGLVAGSPGFMSPEQAEGRDVGPPSDVFSLGAVLTFAATGQGPFGTGSTATMLYRVVHTPPATGDLPDGLRLLVERCLAKDPEQRPTTDQLLAKLAAAHPTAGWLPAPIAQAFPLQAPPDPAPADFADEPPTRLVADLAATPSPPPPPGALDGPSTVTAASARTPDAVAAQTLPGGTRQRPRRGPRRHLAWVLVAGALVAVGVAAAAALANTLGQQPQQGVGAGQATLQVTSSVLSTPAATTPRPQPAATTSGPRPAATTPGPRPAATADNAAASDPLPETSRASSTPPTAVPVVFWTAAVLSSHYKQHAKDMVVRLRQKGFDGAYWFSTADNSILPGYWVVTSGRFNNHTAAAAQAKLLQSSGFDGAYARCVGSRQACLS
jgi:eukaryotic-like serine/threonine-protein kinase